MRMNFHHNFRFWELLLLIHSHLVFPQTIGCVLGRRDGVKSSIILPKFELTPAQGNITIIIRQEYVSNIRKTVLAGL